jgi:hypothetical protein
MIINILDITQLFNPIIIHAFYNISDTLSKFICNIVITDYNEQKIIVRENMDLQSVSFITHMIIAVKDFEKDNQNLSFFCKKLINYYKKNL